MRRRVTPIRSDEGSALMLVPAGVLVLLVLGAIAIDSAVVALAQRELSDRTAAVANDVAGAGASDASFYEAGDVTLSQDAAAAYTARVNQIAGNHPVPFLVTTTTAGANAWAGASRNLTFNATNPAAFPTFFADMLGLNAAALNVPGTYTALARRVMPGANVANA